MAFWENRAFLRSQELMDAKEYAAAAAQLSKVIFLFPDESDLYTRRGDAYLWAYDVNSAIANYKKAAQLTRAKTPMAVTKPVTISLAETLDWQGCMAFLQGRVDQAHALFNTALQYNKSCTMVAFHRGIASLHLGRCIEAGWDFQRCINEAYLRPYQWVALALLLLKEHDVKASRKYITHAMVGYSGNDAVQVANEALSVELIRRRTKVVALMDDGQFEDAGRILDDLVDANENDPELYRLRAKCLSSLKMYTAAVQDLFESIVKAGGSDEASEELLSSTLVIIAEELFAKGDPEQALEYFTEAIKWNPTVPQYFLYRGKCHCKMGNQELGKIDYEQALELERNHEEAKRHLASLHHEWGLQMFNKGELAKAEADFTQCIAYQPESPLYYFRRAQCRLMDKESHSPAVVDLLRCHSLGNNTPEMMRLIQQYCALPATLSKPQGDRDAFSADGKHLYTIVDDVSSLGQRQVQRVQLRPQTHPSPTARKASVALCQLRSQPLHLTGSSAQELRPKVPTLTKEHVDVNKPTNIWESSRLPRKLQSTVRSMSPCLPSKKIQLPGRLTPMEPKRETPQVNTDGPTSIIKRKYMGPSVSKLRSLQPAKPADLLTSTSTT